MTWYPHGPDFVFTPRDGNFRRLSRRNEWGRQGLTSHIAVDPTDPATIYVVERPSSGGASAFRTRTEGGLWTPIADSLQQVDPNVDPVCIAINPAHPEIIYMGTWDNTGIYVSNDRGDHWGSRNPIPGNVRRLIVDPRTAADPMTTVLYAVTTAGVYRSSDGGALWTQVLAGDVWSMVAYIPATGTTHFYAGVYGIGVFHATDPTAPANWTNLNTLGIGLPAHTAGAVTEPEGNFNAILLDYCPRDPNRIYAWMTKQTCDTMGAHCNQVTAALYTTSSPSTSWTSVPMVSPPGPSYWFYNFTFGVAPNSPGNGNNDVLFFGSIGLSRSIDGGRTWQNDAIGYHADQHAFAFFPENPPAGVIPFMYVGCDGGLGVSSKFADPTSSFTATPTDFNHDLGYTDSLIYQNFNHGKQSSAVYQYNSDPTVSALGYIGCQDTGVNAGNGALGWRGIADADAGSIAIARGADGVKVWGIIGAYCDWPGFRIWLWTDRGEFGPSATQVTLGAGGSLVAGTSNYVAGLDGQCLAGAATRLSTSLSAPITATGVQAVTPTSMNDIGVDTVLAIGGDPCVDISREDVSVSAVTATTLTANFTKTHEAGTCIRIEQDHYFMVRIDGSGIAKQISQEFSPRIVRIVATSSANPNLLCCATDDQRVWVTNIGATASSTTIWTEIAGGRPTGIGITISEIAIDGADNVYVLLVSNVTTGGGEFVTTSPLFLLSGGNWVHQNCTGLPTAFNFGKLVADPVQNDILYASQGARAYKLTRAGGSWNWQDISDGLPGQWIYDLWIGNIGGATIPKVILRAAIPTRGVWEVDVTAVATTPAVALYLRDNFLDQGWLPVSPDGVSNPYNPAETLYHYQCADIKIDARQPGTTSAAPFFQTDPEGSLPITHVLFDQLKDNSQNLPGNNLARVHVQVHNRSRTPANNVRVWAIYCNAAAGVPALSASPSTGNAFDFWSQFTVTGQIIPTLPADSPWKSLGSPQLLSGIDAATPKVASWDWTVPLLPSGDPGHFCMVAFIHSATSLINESSFNVDEMTPRNKQVGQKNLHIGPPLPPGPTPGGSAGSGSGGVPGGQRMQEYVEFHNPTASPREAALVFDLRSLPPALKVSFQLTKLDTAAPLSSSVFGISRIKQPGVIKRFAKFVGTFFRWIGWIIQWLGCWLENLGRWLLGLQRKRCRLWPDVTMLPFDPTIYEIAPSSRAEVRGVRLQPFGVCAALLQIENLGAVEPGCDYRFEVQQKDLEKVVGGSTYIVCVAGQRRLPEQVVVPSHHAELGIEVLSRIEREAEPLKYIPPHAKENVEKREREQGRKP